MYITTSLFTNFTVAVLLTPTFYRFLKRADGSLAFNFIWKVIPLDAASKNYAIISICNSITLV